MAAARRAVAIAADWQGTSTYLVVVYLFATRRDILLVRTAFRVPAIFFRLNLYICGDNFLVVSSFKFLLDSTYHLPLATCHLPLTSNGKVGLWYIYNYIHRVGMYYESYECTMVHTRPTICIGSWLWGWLGNTSGSCSSVPLRIVFLSNAIRCILPTSIST